MSSEHSVTDWLTRLKEGDSQAASAIWRRYSQQMIRVARDRMSGMPRRAYDEEDAAMSAFNLFTHRVQAGSFPQLGDRNDLWRLLFLLTTQRVAAWRRRESAYKRGGTRKSPASMNAEDELALLEVACKEPTPEFLAQAMENCERLLGQLEDRSRKIAVMKMEGYSNHDISVEIGVTERTVERKLQGIRRTWRGSFEDDP